MAIFQPRNRVQIIRDMVARVIARSSIKGLTRNSVIYHVLAAAATEDAEIYVQAARLRRVFSIDRATGTDLDERAAEIQPGVIVRRQALRTTGEVTFTRPGTLGVVLIPAGTVVAGNDAQGQVKFKTTANASIAAGFSSVSGVNVVALEAGDRGNLSAGGVAQFVTRIPGVTAVTNPSDYANGRDRESDEEFRGRLKAYTQSLSRGTPTALEGFAKNVLLADGRRVLFANTFEPTIPNGQVTLYIDDGTGGAEEFDSSFVGAPETIISSALGGETEFFTGERPIRDDGTFILRINAVAQLRGAPFDAGPAQYTLNPANGQIVLDSAAYPTGLTAADTVTAEYRYYTGLIQGTQKVIDGDPLDPIRFPGVRPAGIRVTVDTPQTLLQSITASVSVLPDFDPTDVLVRVTSTIQNYINTLDIGEDVIVSEIIERAMAESGMFDIKITTLTGSTPPVNQVILDTQVARINAAAISLT